MSTLWMVVALGSATAVGCGLASLWLRRRHRAELDELDEAMAAEVDRRTRTYDRLSARVRDQLERIHEHVASQVRERIEAYTELQEGVARMIVGFEDREARSRALLAAQRDRIRRLEDAELRRTPELAPTPALEGPAGPTENERRRLESTIEQLRQSFVDLEALWGRREAELGARIDELSPLEDEVRSLRGELAASQARRASAADDAAELERLRDEHDAVLWELEDLERRLWAAELPAGTGTGTGTGAATLASLMQSGDAGARGDERVPTLGSLARSLEERPERAPDEDGG